MSLPEEFSAWDHLREQLIAAHNMNVNRTFLGVPDNDISTSMGGMKVACLLEEDDTVDMFLLRMYLYYFVFQGNLPQPIYGIPVSDYDSEITYRPQIKLIFKEDWNAHLLTSELYPATAEISYRLMHETGATMTPAKAKTIALKIKELFSLEGGFTFEKGPQIVYYKDSHNGCEFRLLVVNEAEGVRVIERVLEVAGHSFDEHKVSVSQSRQSFPANPGLQEVYGREQRKPRRRPTTRVRFKRAELVIWGLRRPLVLVDRITPTRGLVPA